jgi:hypothetical protein
MMAVIVVIFWIVGMVTGMVSAVFLLSLEEKYIFQSAKSLSIEMKIRLGSYAQAFLSSQKVFLRNVFRIERLKAVISRELERLYHSLEGQVMHIMVLKRFRNRKIS